MAMHIKGQRLTAPNGYADVKPQHDKWVTAVVMPRWVLACSGYSVTATTAMPLFVGSATLVAATWKIPG